MKIGHYQHVAMVIRNNIDILDGKFNDDNEEQLEKKNEFFNVVLGAAQRPVSVLDIEQMYPNDPAFLKFREKFCKFLETVPFPDHSSEESNDSSEEENFDE